MRLIIALVVCACLWGCKTVPVFDAEGNPTGETTQEFDRDGAAAVAQGASDTAAVVLPPPFNLIVPGVLGLLTMALTGTKENSQ